MSRYRRHETAREYYKRTSNNPENPNQNICTQAVAKYLGVDKMVRSLHIPSDIVKASRKMYTVRSRFSKVKGLSVGGARKMCAKITQQETDKEVVGYLVGVERHRMLLGADGQTLVDTDPRQRDRRKLKDFYIVYR